MIASLTAENGQTHRRSVNSLRLREGRAPPPASSCGSSQEQLVVQTLPDMTNCRNQELTGAGLHTFVTQHLTLKRKPTPFIPDALI